MYSKTCVKQPLKNRQNKDLNDKLFKNVVSLMKVKSIAEFCNTFDLHLVIIGLENQFSAVLRVAIFHRF